MEQPIVQPTSQLSFEMMQMLDRSGNILQWKVPRWETSKMIPLMTGPQKAAISLWFWLGLLLIPAGIIAALVTWKWYWLLLLPAAILLFKANRLSVDQFFIQNLKENRAFYDKANELGIETRVVIKGPKGDR